MEVTHLNGVELSMKSVPLSSQNTVEFTTFLPFSHTALVKQERYEKEAE
jgi:hypothetical protein